MKTQKQNEPQLSAEMEKKITDIIDEYVISHKENAQCKCVEGARGHLRAKLFRLFDTFSQKHKGAAIIVVCPKCNYPEESCKCVFPEELATALEEQRAGILSEIESWLVDETGYSAFGGGAADYKSVMQTGYYEGRNRLRKELRDKLAQMKGKE